MLANTEISWSTRTSAESLRQNYILDLWRYDLIKFELSNRIM